MLGFFFFNTPSLPPPAPAPLVLQPAQRAPAKVPAARARSSAGAGGGAVGVPGRPRQETAPGQPRRHHGQPRLASYFRIFRLLPGLDLQNLQALHISFFLNLQIVSRPPTAHAPHGRLAATVGRAGAVGAGAGIRHGLVPSPLVWQRQLRGRLLRPPETVLRPARLPEERRGPQRRHRQRCGWRRPRKGGAPLPPPSRVRRGGGASPPRCAMLRKPTRVERSLCGERELVVTLVSVLGS